MKRHIVRYEVWRYHMLQGTFTFKELKEWMLLHLPSHYHDEIRKSKRGDTKHYNENSRSLAWIAIGSEYCSVKRVKE